jgi:hypothetical protein
MAATYRFVGRLVVEQAQGWRACAGLPEELLGRPSAVDLTAGSGMAFGLQPRDDARLLRGVPSSRDFRDGVPEILGHANILCAKKEHAVAKYAPEGMRNKLLAAEHRTALPMEQLLIEEMECARCLERVRRCVAQQTTAAQRF